MTRRRLRVPFHEPSLVPLADLLTNTVGIMLFILVFTVLAAGGAVVAKRLPMEHATEAKPLYFVCTNDRLLPLHATELITRFREPLGKPASYYEVEAWVKRYNARQIEDEYFVVQGEGEARYEALRAGLDLSVKFTPRDDKGETPSDLKLDSARFRHLLTAHDPKDRFVFFLVRPDSLNVFTAARALALEQNFSTGWGPLAADRPIRFTLTGAGRKAGPQ